MILHIYIITIIFDKKSSIFFFHFSLDTHFVWKWISFFQIVVVVSVLLYIYKEWRTIWKKTRCFTKDMSFKGYFFLFLKKGITKYLSYFIHCELQTQFHQPKFGSDPQCSMFGQSVQQQLVQLHPRNPDLHRRFRHLQL